MDKETIYFLVSESRILGFSDISDCEEFSDCIKDAIALGDRSFKVVEVELAITLADWPKEPEIIVKHKDTTDDVTNNRIAQALSTSAHGQQYDFWDNMPTGIYRIRKLEGENKLLEMFIEYCPDIINSNWEKVEEIAWRPKI